MTDQDIETKCRSICNEVGRKRISDELKGEQSKNRISDELGLSTTVCFHSSGRMFSFMGMAHGEAGIVHF